MYARLAVLTMFLLAALPVQAGTLSPAAESALQQLLERGKQTHSNAVLVLQDGHEIGHYYPDDKAPGPIELMSVTKSVVALGIGQLLDRGKIKSLDQPVADFYPEWKQGLKKNITLRMLMDHTSGLQNLPSTRPEIYPAPDVIQLALAAELTGAPGKSFAYNNKAVNLLAGIIEKASGEPMDVFFRDGLFKAMGIQPGPWGKDKTGHPYAMAGLSLTAADAAKIGQLLLNDGRWNGRTLISTGFMKAMLAPGQAMPACGLLWWLDAAWMRGSFKPDVMARMRHAGVPAELAGKFASLQGKAMQGDREFFAFLQHALGKDAMRVWTDEITSKIAFSDLTDRESGPVIAYNAKGDQGQYIVVVPQAHLVAVRQIEAQDHPTEDDNYGDFEKQVFALAKTLGAKFPAAPAGH